MATVAQIAEIRLESGDTNATDYAVSDDMISTWYDESQSICGTAYKVAKARLAKASNSIGASGQNQTINPKVSQIQSLLEAMRMDCVDALPLAGIGYLNLGIDEETQLVDIE